jgi:hypothetical protein
MAWFVVLITIGAFASMMPDRLTAIIWGGLVLLGLLLVTLVFPDSAATTILITLVSTLIPR